MNAVTNLVDLRIARPDNAAATRAAEALERVNALVVDTPEDYEAAAAFLREIKSRWNETEDQRKHLVAPINEAKDRVQRLFAGPDGPLTIYSKAEGIVKNKLADYQREQERIRQEEQRIANERARKEREELEARAREQERKAREKADADRKAAEEAAAAGRAEEAAKLEARADRTENKAAEKAQALELQAASVVAPVIEREAPKVAGLKTREVWKFEITDASKINPTFLCPDLDKIGKTVKALKNDAPGVIGAGVKVWPDKSLASGS
jgi:DNA repair exonuclease SbcCD ATPase subunit